MIRRASLSAILLALMLPVAGAAQAFNAGTQPRCWTGQTQLQLTEHFDTTNCPESQAVFTLEGMLDLTLDQSMINPNISNQNLSVRYVMIECAICSGPSCDLTLTNAFMASQTFDLEGQTTVLEPYKVWFGRDDQFEGGLRWAPPSEFHSYACRISVGHDGQSFLTPSQYYGLNWDPNFRWAKVLDTPTPVLELSGTIN